MGSGASSVKAGGWLTGGGVADGEESGAFPLSNTSSTAGVTRADEGICWKINNNFYLLLWHNKEIDSEQNGERM